VSTVWEANPVFARTARIKLSSAKGTSKWLVIGVGLVIGYFYLRLMWWLLTRATPSDGQALWAVLSFVQLVLLLFVTTALTAPLVSSERERETWDALVLSPLTPWQIIGGMLIGRLSWGGWLLLGLSPICLFASWVGRLDPAATLAGYLLLAATAFAVAAISLLCSCLFSRTPGALATAYVAVFLLSTYNWLAELLRFTVTGPIYSGSSGTPVTVNPLLAMSWLAEHTSPFRGPTSHWFEGCLLATFLLVLVGGGCTLLMVCGFNYLDRRLRNRARGRKEE